MAWVRALLTTRECSPRTTAAATRSPHRVRLRKTTLKAISAKAGTVVKAIVKVRRAMAATETEESALKMAGSLRWTKPGTEGATRVEETTCSKSSS